MLFSDIATAKVMPYEKAERIAEPIQQNREVRKEKV